MSNFEFLVLRFDNASVISEKIQRLGLTALLARAERKPVQSLDCLESRSKARVAMRSSNVYINAVLSLFAFYP